MRRWSCRTPRWWSTARRSPSSGAETDAHADPRPGRRRLARRRLRPGDLRLTDGDEQVLRLVVPLLAQTLRPGRSPRSCSESRGRTIAAVEEERRRLRRELHDGLGPRLSGVAFTSDAARNLIRTDPAAAEQMLAQLRADTVIAIEEIRRMVYAMRPPALDELGLVPALRQQAVGPAQQRRPPGRGPRHGRRSCRTCPRRSRWRRTGSSPRRSPTSPGTAPARRGGADRAPTTAGSRLEVDRRRARAAAWRPGVGLSSMRDRADGARRVRGRTGPDGGPDAAACVTRHARRQARARVGAFVTSHGERR